MKKRIVIIWILLVALLLSACSPPAPVRRADRLVQSWSSQSRQRCYTQYSPAERVYRVCVFCEGEGQAQQTLSQLLRRCFSGSGIAVELLLLPCAQAKK